MQLFPTTCWHLVDKQEEMANPSSATCYRPWRKTMTSETKDKHTVEDCVADIIDSIHPAVGVQAKLRVSFTPNGRASHPFRTPNPDSFPTEWFGTTCDMTSPPRCFFFFELSLGIISCLPSQHPLGQTLRARKRLSPQVPSLFSPTVRYRPLSALARPPDTQAAEVHSRLLPAAVLC
jgi:hypothetical protein